MGRDRRRQQFLRAGRTNSSFSTAITSGDTGGQGTFWVKIAAQNTTKALSLAQRSFGFFDGATTSTAEQKGFYYCTTNSIFGANNLSFILTNKVYHFKFMIDPLDRTYEGFLTNVTDTPTIGFSSTVVAGRRLRSRNNVPYQQPWWTNGPVFNSSYSNLNAWVMWEARSQNGVAALAGSKAGWCPTNFMSLDNLKATQLSSNLWPPLITLVNLHVNHTFYPASSNFVFTATTYGNNSLRASNVVVRLNGANVSSGLALDGTDASASRTVSYNGLTDNTLYFAALSVTDSGGNITTNYFRFDTFNTNSATVIETENYNFEPTNTSCLAGQTDVQTDRFIQNWVYSGVSSDGVTLINTTNGYIGRSSAQGIDYNFTVASSANGDSEGVFRACENGKIATQTGNLDDDIRQVYLNFNDAGPTTANPGMVEVNNMKVGVGDWWNYTHMWPTGNYLVYLRGGNYNKNMTNSLDLVKENGVSSYTNSTQQTTNFGRFILPFNPNLTVNSFAFTQPLQDQFGNSRVVPLGGKQTLRLTVTGGDTVNNDSGLLNYMVFVPVPDTTITNLTQVSANDIRFFFNSITNVHYTIQTNSVVTGGTWNTMTTKIGTGGLVQVDDTAPGGVTNRFYRVTTP